MLKWNDEVRDVREFQIAGIAGWGTAAVAIGFDFSGSVEASGKRPRRGRASADLPTEPDSASLPVAVLAAGASAQGRLLFEQQSDEWHRENAGRFDLRDLVLSFLHSGTFNGPELFPFNDCAPVWSPLMEPAVTLAEHILSEHGLLFEEFRRELRASGRLTRERFVGIAQLTAVKQRLCARGTSDDRTRLAGMPVDAPYARTSVRD